MKKHITLLFLICLGLASCKKTSEESPSDQNIVSGRPYQINLSSENTVYQSNIIYDDKNRLKEINWSKTGEDVDHLTKYEYGPDQIVITYYDDNSGVLEVNWRTIQNYENEKIKEQINYGNYVNNQWTYSNKHEFEWQLDNISRVDYYFWGNNTYDKSTYSEYIYNDDGILKKIIVYHKIEDESWIPSYEYNYTINGTLISTEITTFHDSYTGQSYEQSKTVFSYNDNKLVEISNYSNDEGVWELTSNEEFTYNGVLTSIKGANYEYSIKYEEGEENIVNIYSYEYHSLGKFINYPPCGDLIDWIFFKK